MESERRWRLRDLTVLMAAMIGVEFVLVRLSGGEPPFLPREPLEVAHACLLMVAPGAAVVWLARRRRLTLGLRGCSWRWASTGLLTGVALVGVQIGLRVATGATVTGVTGVAVGTLLVLVLVTPLEEEVVYRGLLFGGLRGPMGPTLAAVVGAGVFGAVHGAGAALDAGVAGLVLVWLYHRSGSLLPGVVAHAVNNLAAVVVR